MTDAEIQVAYAEPSLPNAQPEQRIETTWGNIRVVSSVPTWTPQGKQEDSMALYINGNTQRLYFYDFTNNIWRFFTHTTVAASGSSALEGDVSLAGSGLTVTEASQTITIATKSPYFGSGSGNFQFVSGSNSTDTTFNIGFDPKLILFWGRIFGSAISSYNSDAYANSNTVMRPSIWLNGTYEIAPVIASGGTLSGDLFSGLMQFTSSFSNQIFLTVNSHDATNTVIRFSRLSGATDERCYYQYHFIAFP